jgi:hypothetical protein
MAKFAYLDPRCLKCEEGEEVEIVGECFEGWRLVRNNLLKEGKMKKYISDMYFLTCYSY